MLQLHLKKGEGEKNMGKKLSCIPNKYLLVLLGVIFLIGMASAQDFSISLQPHYFSNGYEILNTPDTPYSAVSFEVIGTSNLNYERIVNMTLSAVNPANLKFSDSSSQTLKILQSKTLWTSNLYDLTGYSNGENVTFLVGVIGTNEGNGEKTYSQANYTIMVNNPNPAISDSSFWQFVKNIGSKIYPGDSQTGIAILIIGIILLSVLIYYSNKNKLWKKKAF